MNYCSGDGDGERGTKQWGWGGDGERVCGVGVGMGTGTMGMDGDRDQFLSPCSSLVETNDETVDYTFDALRSARCRLKEWSLDAEKFDSKIEGSRHMIRFISA